MKWDVNCCDGIYNSFDVHFTSACDNRCRHCIDMKYQGKGIIMPDPKAIAKTIIDHSEGYDDVLLSKKSNFLVKGGFIQIFL